MTFTKLPNPIPVAVATPVSKLNAVGVSQVPITWENGRPSIFSMLVVPGVSWPILFGQNHLRMTQAHTDPVELTVHFRDPALSNVGIQIHYRHFHLCPHSRCRRGKRRVISGELFQSELFWRVISKRVILASYFYAN